MNINFDWGNDGPMDLGYVDEDGVIHRFIGYGFAIPLHFKEK